MSVIFQDLRYAVRVLLKSPGYTIAAILVLGLGIGANTAVFSVINAVLLRPLPYPQADQLVSLRQRTGTIPSASVDLLDYLDWRATQRSFTDLSIFRRDTFNLSFNPGSGTPPERVGGLMVSANYLSVLGMPPVLGRNFTEAEDAPGGPLAALISNALWRRRFGADPQVVGKRLIVDGESREIVGVLAGAMSQGRAADVMVPFGKLRVDPGVNRRDNHPGMSVLGRLRPGVTLVTARQEMTGIVAELERRYPESNTGWGIVVRPLLDQAVGSYRESLYLLLGAVGCVLLIACANVANLQLARATGRTKELAVRAALGAGRGRLVRQLLTESVLLGLCGGVVGILLSLWAMDAIISLAPAASPRFQEARLDLAALGFTGVVALGTGVLAGLWPAWRVSRTAAMATALHEGSARGGSGGQAQQRARAALVVAQVALAVVLLASAGTTLQSFWRLRNEPLGFRPGGVFTGAVSLPEAHYPSTEKNKAILFFQQALAQVRALPGVVSASMAGNLPYSGMNWDTMVHVTGTPQPKPGEWQEAVMNYAMPEYFRTLGVQVLHGREFGPQDALGSQKKAVIDEEFARRYLAGKDPVGQYLDDPQSDEKNPAPMLIVGVVAHVRHAVPGENPVSDRLPQLYVCASQNDAGAGSFVVRVASGDPLRLAEPLRRIVQGLDPEVPVADVNTLEGAIGASLAPQRLTMVLLGTFAALALTLASIGLYGTMALGVTQRTRELGIRLALGAQRGAVLGLIMRQGTVLVGVGLGVGLLAALALGRGLASILYGVSGSDPATLGAVSLVLAGTALLACWIPARRAMRVDPMVALRDE